MFGYFYNKNFRKIVVGFGALFNNIYVEHANPDDSNNPLRIRVPITYAPQEKFIRRLLEPSSITDGTRIETQLPRLSYIMSSVKPDSSRRRNKLSPLVNSVVNGECSSNSKEVFEQNPVNIAFSLFIYTRHIDDTLQIVEQIIPYFNPDHIIELEMNDVASNLRIPIVMTDNNISEKYDGDLMNRRINISSFSFIAKTFVYGPVNASTLITDVGTVDIELE